MNGVFEFLFCPTHGVVWPLLGVNLGGINMRVWLACRVERVGLWVQAVGAALVRFAPVVAYGRGTREAFKRVMEWDA